MKSKFDPDKHHRKSIRIPGYDYSQAGWYFVTVCAFQRQCLFGEIKNGEMKMNDFGRMVEKEWLRTAALRNNVLLDEYIVMPDHFHGIINIFYDGRDMLNSGAPGDVGAYGHTPLHNPSFRSPTRNLGAIIRGFKSTTTKHINETRQSPGSSVWQRNYYEHIIRDEIELNQIRQYIRDNPLKWENDKNDSAMYKHGTL